MKGRGEGEKHEEGVESPQGNKKIPVGDWVVNKKVTIPQTDQENSTGDQGRPEIPKYSGKGSSRGWGGLFGWTTWAGKPLHNTHKACNGYA